MAKKTYTLSLNIEIHKQGKDQAKKQRRSLSAYVEDLILKDKTK
jgi:predicted HicB family RNase H-like nuclease